MPRSIRPANLLLALVTLAVFCGGQAFAQRGERFVGIGISISADDDGSIWIDQVLPRGPAARAGVHQDDELLAVDGRSVAGFDPRQVAAMIGGPEGSSVTLTVRAEEGRPRRLTMRRRLLDVSAGRAAGSHASPAPDTTAPKASTGAASPPPGGTLKFRRVAIHDPGIGNREAVSFLVPAGWSVSGGITWLPNYSILANLLLEIRDPQSGATIQFLPVQNFTWLRQTVVPMAPGTNYLGNVVWAPIGDVPQFIRTFYSSAALSHLRDARQVSVEALPGVAAAVAHASQASNAVAARVRYAYTRDGRPWTEDVFVTLVYYTTPMGTIWSVDTAYALRAPQDRFAQLEPVMLATVSSKHISLDWFGAYRYVQKLFQNRMRQSIANAAAISATVTRNSEEIRRMYAHSYREASASWDRINRQFSESIRGVETYDDPYKDHPVELPSGYQDAWVNANGDYLLSNNANFDPNVGDNVEWTRMRGAAGR